MKLPAAATISYAAYGLLADSVNAALVLRDVKSHLIVEPFVASWCANQFPDLLDVDGYVMSGMVSNSLSHVVLEPFLGEWCFDQFPQRLPPDNQDRETARSNLYASHKPIEPYLERWGKDSSNTAQAEVISLEPYIGHWCSAQYPEALADLSMDTETFFAMVRDNHQKLEPALAKWCFAQFPEELGSVNNEKTLERLKVDHEVVERDLIRWVLANDAATEASRQQNLPILLWAVIVTGLLVVDIFFRICCACQRRRATKEMAATRGDDASGIEEPTIPEVS